MWVSVTDGRPAFPLGGQGVRLAVLWGALLLVACSPTFNWRQVRLADFGLQVWLPCKPQAAQRTVGVGGQAAELHMLSCDAGGVTFAVSALRLPAGVEVGTVLDGWKRASLLSLKVPVEQARAWQPAVRWVGGVTGWQAEGVRHDGTSVVAQAVMLSHGAEVYQVAVYGPVTQPVLTELLEGLQREATP
jgi:hypothetical protein